MKYYLKRDLPTIKAGTEMVKVEGYENTWIEANKSTSHPWQYFPPEVLDEWIEERDGRWKPMPKEIYFYPDFANEDLIESASWESDEDMFDGRLLSFGLVCKTREEACALARRMLEAIKE